MKSLEFELREAVRASDLQARCSCCWLLVMVFYLAFPLMVAVPWQSPDNSGDTMRPPWLFPLILTISWLSMSAQVLLEDKFTVF